MNEPEQVLLAGAADKMKPIVRRLREQGWAAELIAHADPLKLSIEIDLSGLPVPVEVSDAPPPG